MVASPLDLIDNAYECLDEGDLDGANSYLEELRLQKVSFGATARLKDDIERLEEAIREKRSKQVTDLTDAAQAAPAPLPG